MAKSKQIVISKHSSEREPFSPEKLLIALSKAGANENLATNFLIDVESRLYDGIPIKKNYKIATSKLKILSKPMAAGFHLKHKIIELGSSGFPFESLLFYSYKVKKYNQQFN